LSKFLKDIYDIKDYYVQERIPLRKHNLMLFCSLEEAGGAGVAPPHGFSSDNAGVAGFAVK